MAVSIERAGWGSTARSPGEECLQVASVSRSAVHQKAQADFSPAWAGTQWAVSNSAFWCENRRFGQFIPTFPSTLVLEKPALLVKMTCLSPSNICSFFFSWQKHVLFSLSGHFCAKKGKMDVLEECPWKVWTTQVARWSRRCNQLNNRTTKEQPRLR